MQDDLIMVCWQVDGCSKLRDNLDIPDKRMGFKREIVDPFSIIDSLFSICN
jgi:hypothetical protein